MPATTLSPGTSTSNQNAEIREAEAPKRQRCARALDDAHLALAAFLAQSEDGVLRKRLAGALRNASEAVAQLPRHNLQAPEVSIARDLVRELSKEKVPAQLSSELAAFELSSESRTGWAGLIARMLIEHAGRSSTVPTFDEVPDWLWGDYAAWLFTPPQSFAPREDWEKYFAQLIRHLTVLNRWAARNIGSAAVRSAGEAYLRVAASLPAERIDGRWPEYAKLRGEILTRFAISARESYEPEINLRAGRRLRLGFVHSDFASGPDICAALPCFQHLDTRAFDISFFALRSSDSTEAQYCARVGRGMELLPENVADRVLRLRAERLDALVFVGDLGSQFNEITELALHRLAPLQVANDRTGFTSGLPEIDLSIGGAKEEDEGHAREFTERLGLLRGSPISLGVLETNETEPAVCTRETLQLPLDGVLLASVVTPAGTSRETLEAWVDVLAMVEGSILLVALMSNATQLLSAEFCRTIDGVLAARGIAGGRVNVFPVDGQGHQDVRKLIALSDLFLDSPGRHNPIWVEHALSLGIPTVSSAHGSAGRHSASRLLHKLGLSELTAASVEEFVRVASAIATDPLKRSDVKSRIGDVIAAGPEFLDTMAASDAFGALIETSFDELSALGAKEFRATREPLSCFGTDNVSETVAIGLAALDSGEIESAAFESTLALRTEPGNPSVRSLRGRVLLAQNDASRAVDYLLAAVERGGGGDVANWFALAQALRSNNQTPQALQALETCLRMDPKHVEALLMLVELANFVGGTDIAQEALQCLQQIVPDDPRVVAIS